MNNIHFENKCLNFMKYSGDSLSAFKFVVSIFLSDIYPLVSRIAQLLQLSEENKSVSNVLSRDVYILCSDQIKKCIATFVEIIKREHKEGICLQESRQCTLERISWCYQKLLSIEKQLNRQPYSEGSEVESENDLFIMNSMYFVNWVDQTFEVLSQLSTIIYKPCCTESEELYNNWKCELFECVCGLHTSVDELLLSAMTLCKYCLPTDQLIVKARCQVVLRETKALLSDLLLSNLDSRFEAVIDNLKLPIKPSNVNVLIDVLKDVLYVLETNTNTALLSLLVHCFSNSISPVDILRNHLKTPNECTCPDADKENVVETCEFVKDFDLYNERLMQIGSFAMSCSSDQKRILGLRSGLASLEALDPHLVPALLHASSSHHATILVNTWSQEVMQIRDNVFLIVDPSAFAEKAKQMMHQTLLEITKGNCYENGKGCEVINIGVLVHKFFNVYKRYEPDALVQQEGLQSLLQDLNKVQMECKIVSNSLCSPGDYKYDLNKTTVVKVSLEQFIKRLKLLYTIVKRIHYILNPKDNDEEFYQEEPDDRENKTYTLDNKNGNTYSVNSLKKNNMTRSIFARTDNIRSSTAKFPLAILTKHLKAKQDLSFSIKLDDMCDLSEVKKREQSILYHTPLKTKSSLRKAVLSKHLMPRSFKMADTNSESSVLEKGSLMDETMNLQITDILNQLNNLTDSVATIATNKRRIDSTILIDTTSRKCEEITRNVLTRNELSGAVNNHAISKKVWNINVNNSAIDNDSVVNVTQPSEVNTLERISDLDLVESRLSNLKFGHIETSL